MDTIKSVGKIEGEQVLKSVTFVLTPGLIPPTMYAEIVVEYKSGAKDIFPRTPIDLHGSVSVKFSEEEAVNEE